MDELIIRQAEEKDIAAIAAMDKICFALPWSEQSFFEEITRNDIALYLVAEICSSIVGYAGLWMIFDEGHITNVAVHPDFRKKGIAEALVFALTDFSHKEGITMFTLEVRASNVPAISLYRKLGFRECGVRKAYYEDNSEDALIMWRM